MSFDLAVWFETERISAASAVQKYIRLCNEDQVDLIESSAVAAFQNDLLARYPDLTQNIDEEPENPPWTAALDHSAGHVIMTIAWSRVDEVAPHVLELAERHGLICFDPQTEDVHIPPALRRDQTLVLRRCISFPLADPDPDVIALAVRRLSERNWFLILDAGGHFYVQVGLGSQAGVGPEQVALEHRDGSPDRHERTIVADPETLIRALQGYAAGDLDWKAGMLWEDLVL